MADPQKPVDHGSRSGNEGYQPTRSPSSPQQQNNGYQPPSQTQTTQHVAPPPKKR